MRRAVLVGAGLLLPVFASAQLSIVDNLPGTFVDISGSGTPLNLGDDTLANITTSVGNSVFAAGTHRVGNNGLFALNSTTASGPFGNNTIPPTGSPTGLTAGVQYFAPYWDDWDSDTGNVFWQEISGTLYVQWHNRPHFSNSADHATMQVQIPSSGPAFAQFIYVDIEGSPNWLGGAGATIGYVDGTSNDNGGNNILWSFNTAGSVHNGSVLSIVPEPASLGLLAIAGMFLIRRR